MDSQPRNRPKLVGLKLDNIKDDDLEEIALRVEEAIRGFIDEKARGLVEADIIVRLERTTESVNVVIDVRLRGGAPVGALDIDTLLRDSVNVGKREFEELISRYAKGST
ncbi:MAG: hypothetical protein ACP5GP_01000 [Thermogladius sp.]